MGQHHSTIFSIKVVVSKHIQSQHRFTFKVMLFTFPFGLCSFKNCIKLVK